MAHSMSAWETVPSVEDLATWTDGEIEEYLRDVFDELSGYSDEARRHDRDGYFADLAWSEKCQALGHEPNEFGEWDEDELHESGWDGELLCVMTRYGEACTLCEGECSYEPAPNLWTLRGVAA